MTRILTIDGGGIRGLIVLHVLCEIEKRTGKRINELFDVISGVSVGAMIAAMLKIGEISCDEMIELFKKSGKNLFSKPSPLSIVGAGLFVPKYSAEKYGAELRKILGDRKMSDVTGLIIYAFDVVSRSPLIFTGDAWLLCGEKFKVKKRPKFFTSGDKYSAVEDMDKISTGINYMNIEIWKACVASASAPTFFAPYTEIDGKILWDGGVAANNPATLTYSYSIINYSTQVDYFVSIGTGDTAKTLGKRDLRGVFQLENIIDVCLEAPNDIVEYTMNALLGEKFFRLQEKIENIKLDDIGAFRKLELAAKKIIESNRFEDLIEKLSVE
jgi:patatin-like phospholipase/acyl hydrolase